jgi:hypothetical protein
MLALRYKNLVYIPVSKNASTSFTFLFEKTLHWSRILTENIDWENDIVFAHIQNPYNRHIKGTFQFLQQNNLLNIIDDPKFAFLVSSACFDQHSYPLSYMFNNHVNQIQWIPLDHPAHSCNCLTVQFLKNNNFLLDETNIPFDNKSNSLILNKLKDIYKSNDAFSRLFFLLDDDMIIYNQAIIKFNQLL